jgi:hypothetical protein
MIVGKIFVLLSSLTVLLNPQRRVSNGLILKFLWKNGGKWEGSWGAGLIGGQFLGIGRSFMMM